MIPKDVPCKFCGARIIRTPGISTPIEAEWTGYTRHPADGKCNDVLFTSEGGRINCRILPPERDDEIEGWAHRPHLGCRGRNTRREPTEREKAREEYKAFRKEQAGK